MLHRRSTGRTRARLARSRAWGALAVALASVVTVAAATTATGASSSVTVTFSVISSTTIDPSGCVTGTSGQTSFGAIQPPASIVTSLDCTVGFGSSNDTSMLQLYQQDGGSTAMRMGSWALQASGVITELRGLHLVDPDIGFAVGSSGVILRTDDGGVNWVPQVSGTTRSIYDVYSVDGTNVIAAAGNGWFMRSTNGGTTWVDQQQVGGLSWNRLDMATPLVGWAVGNDGTIARTTDGGVSWAAQTSGITAPENIYGVDALDVNEVWVTTGDGAGTVRVIRTTDGGANWAPVTAPPVGSNIGDVAVIDSTTALVVTWGAEVWRTVDSGSSWTQMINEPGSMRSIDQIDASTFVAAGSGGRIWMSEDAGLTWSPVTNPASADLREIDAIDDSTITAVGVGGTIVASPLNKVPDYDSGTSDWTVGGGGHFGACLRSVSDGAVTDGTTWFADSDTIGDEPALSADCADGDADPWNGIAASSGAPGIKLASAPAFDEDAKVHLRFGTRIPATQLPGSYAAPIVFTVVAPVA